MKYDYLFKIVLAGDSNTGKTHFFNLLSDKNIDYLSSTIGTDLIVLYKELFGKTVRVNVWDTAGQERFQSIIQHYFREIVGYILFFNINNVESFQTLERWIKNINFENRCEHHHPILLIGNKNDLEHNVNQIDIIELTEKYNLIYIETSLIYNKINIHDIIELFLEKIYKMFITNNKERPEEDIILCKTIKLSKENNKNINLYHNINNDNDNNNNNNYQTIMNNNCC
jgi:small GTP-binding protein